MMIPPVARLTVCQVEGGAAIPLSFGGLLGFFRMILRVETCFGTSVGFCVPPPQYLRRPARQTWRDILINSRKSLRPRSH